MFRYAWIYIRPSYMECVNHLEISINVAVGNSLPVSAFRIGLVDNLVIYVGKVLYQGYLVSYISKIAADNIPGYSRSCVTNMRVVVWSNPADINLYFARSNRFKYSLVLSQRVIHFDFFHCFFTFAFLIIKPPSHRGGGPLFHSVSLKAAHVYFIATIRKRILCSPFQLTDAFVLRFPYADLQPEIRILCKKSLRITSSDQRIP